MYWHVKCTQQWLSALAARLLCASSHSLHVKLCSLSSCPIASPISPLLLEFLPDRQPDLSNPAHLLAHGLQILVLPL